MVCRRMLLGRGGEMCYLNKLLMLSVLGWLFQVIFSFVLLRLSITDKRN